jgi:hypothetical protein
VRRISFTQRRDRDYPEKGASVQFASQRAPSTKDELTSSFVWSWPSCNPSQGPDQNSASFSPREAPIGIWADSSRRPRRVVGGLSRSIGCGSLGVSRGYNPRTLPGDFPPCPNATGWVVEDETRGETSTSLPWSPRDLHRPLRETNGEGFCARIRPARTVRLAGCSPCTTGRQSPEGLGMSPALRSLDPANVSEYDPPPFRSAARTVGERKDLCQERAISEEPAYPLSACASARR